MQIQYIYGYPLCSSALLINVYDHFMDVIHYNAVQNSTEKNKERNGTLNPKTFSAVLAFSLKTDLRILIIIQLLHT